MQEGFCSRSIIILIFMSCLQSNLKGASNTAQDKAHDAHKEGKGILETAQDKASGLLGTTQSKAEDAKDTAQVSRVMECNSCLS